ncbi:tyrosine-type recombinase/integrase [Methylobacterium sp. HMF5984]|uniref:tyrosine-type recombinase/integrase n=1 Tax=Methylobacterium sp. HMF5984 TaxID=3367370 RepID=UPI003852183D
MPADVVSLVRGKEVFLELPAAPGDNPVPVSFTLGQHARVSLHTRENGLGDARWSAVAAHLKRLYEAEKNGSQTLTPMRAEYLAGLVYQHIKSRFLQSPGSPAGWAAVKSFCRASVQGRIAAVPRLRPDFDPEDEIRLAQEAFGENLTLGIDALSEGHHDTLDQRFGIYVDWILSTNALRIDDASRRLLLDRVGHAAIAAGWRMRRAAERDWSDDPAENRFPKADPGPSSVQSSDRPVAQGVTLTDVFDRWKTETKPAPSTIQTWGGVIRQFVAHLGHEDIARVKAEHVIAWKDALVAQGRRPSTINDGHLSGLKTLLAYAKRNRLVPENVAIGVRVQDRRQAGAGMLAYGDAEVARLLAIAAQETTPAKRWLPWLAVYTGARIGELAQAWGSQVREIDGIPVLVIQPSPDGGTLKNAGSERTVPLHPALVEAGFLEFARACGDRPMFYKRPARLGSEGRHPSKGATNHLATWIREQGFKDPRKAPSHACRHWWKTTASRVGMSDSMADAIQGHSDSSSAGNYRHFALADMATAVQRMPVVGGCAGQ